jgi:uncharacterized protein (DUF1501 family)
MNRRSFLQSTGAFACSHVVTASILAALPAWAAASTGIGNYRKLLVLIELKGGNDGLNTLVPHGDTAYYTLRPKIAIPRDQVLPLSQQVGLHPAMTALHEVWADGQLAVLQGVGYPKPNLSHFRSIEIWDTGSKSQEVLQDGWLTRTFHAMPTPRSFAADGVIVGANDLGPLAGGGARAIALTDTNQFLRRARLAQPAGAPSNKALAHILKVELDIVQAAAHLEAGRTFTTVFPGGAFGNAIRTACQIAANPAGVAVIRVTLNGFDTHANQMPTHARLLAELSNGLRALKLGLQELDRWDDTLVLTYSEFGRRPRENLNAGTDHGTASVQFALGGRVQGGLYGATPDLSTLTSDGNPRYAVDFRSVYATVSERWWGVDARAALGGTFAPMPFIAA